MLATGPTGSQLIGPGPLEVPDEQPRGLGGFKAAELFPGFLVHYLHTQGVRQIGSNELPVSAIAVRAENCKGIPMLSAY